MTSQLSDNDEAEVGERDGSMWTNDAATRITGFAQMAFPPSMVQNSSDWLSGSRQPLPNSRQPSLDLGYVGRGGFIMPPQPSRNLTPTPLLPAMQAELAMMQAQRLAMEEEQARLQRMSEAIYLGQQRFPMIEAPTAPHYGPVQVEAMQRLKKRRRAVPSPVPLSQRGNAFPMPRVDGDGHEIRIKSRGKLQQKWDELAARSKVLFPGTTENQSEYTRWRFATMLGRRRFSLSVQSMRTKNEDDDNQGPLKKRRAN